MAIDIQYLIDNENAPHLVHTYGDSISLYINSRGQYSPKEVTTLGMTDGFSAYIKNAISELNQLIAPTLTITTSPDSADIFITRHTAGSYNEKRYVTSGATGATKVTNNYIGIDETRDQSNAEAQVTFLHELGHSLGLEHNFDGDDGDAFGGEGLSLDTTVMSYGAMPVDYEPAWTAADIRALQHLWGAKGSVPPATDDVIAPFPAEPYDQARSSVGPLYTAAFGRRPDTEGLTYWDNKLAQQGFSYLDAAYAFVNSNEFADRFGSDLSPETFVDSLYTNVLGRLPEGEGAKYWSDLMTIQGTPSHVILAEFSYSPENLSLYNSLL